ncbi:MAG: hypothetical protein ACM33T_12710 [Solirubrobacterales bacterium]
MRVVGDILATISLALFAIPLVIVVIRLMKVPLRRWIPVLVGLAILLTMQWLVANVDPAVWFWLMEKGPR